MENIKTKKFTKVEDKGTLIEISNKEFNEA